MQMFECNHPVTGAKNLQKNFAHISLQYVELAKGLVEMRNNPNYSSVTNDRTPLMEACCAGKVFLTSFIKILVINLCVARSFIASASVR